jgi:hypothetical protein
MIVVNGCPKAGAHAFAALLSRAGAKRCPGTILACTWDQTPQISGAPAVTLDVLRMLPDNLYMIGHVCAHHAQALSNCAVVTVLRDPRNCVISYVRHRKRVDGIDITTAEALTDYWGTPFVELYRGFLGWHGKAAIVHYEKMPASVTGDGSGIYGFHDAQHNTRTGEPSDWSETWGCEDHRAWRIAGGPALAAEAGYR